MHDLYLGVAQDVCASCLVELHEHGHIFDHAGHPITSPDSAYAALSIECRLWCERNNLKVPPGFTVKSLNRDTKTMFPALATYYKAASVKILIGFCSYISTKLCDGSWRSKVRSTCLWGLSDFIYKLDCAGPWLTAEEAKGCYDSGYLFLDSMQELANIAGDNNEFLWKVRPKTHYMCHHFDDVYSTRANPRHRTCFMDEDFVGKLARLGRHCHRKTVALRVLQRYLLFINQHWRRRKTGAYAFHN